MRHKVEGLKFRHVDVFSSRPLSGNGLCVFWESSNLSVDVMQQLTQEMRQFESIFLTKTADNNVFKARIFTMEEELDFAGHPVLGAAAVLHEQYGTTDSTTWILELNKKQVQVESARVNEVYQTTMDQGQAEFGQILDEEKTDIFMRALNIDHSCKAKSYPLQVVSTGLPYLIVPVTGGLEQAKIEHNDFSALLDTVGAKFVYVFDLDAREGRTWDNNGLVKDVATGSAAGPTAAYLVKHGLAAISENIVIYQGRFVGRPSQINAFVYGNASEIQKVFVSGTVSMVATGVFG